VAEMRASRLASAREISYAIGARVLAAKLYREQGGKVAWVTALSPVEVLYAAGIMPLYPEQYSAACGAFKTSLKLVEKAEEAGYSQDLCSYFRCHIGHVLSGEGPLGGLAKPDILLLSGNLCLTRVKWWEILSEKLKAPLFHLDIPFVAEEDSWHLEYVRWQIEELMEFLAEAGVEVTLDSLKRSVELSDEASKLWNEVMDLRKVRPCPMGARDAFTSMFLIVTCPGHPVAVVLLKRLLKEVRERVADGRGALEEEKFRVMLDNIPTWYDLWFVDYLEERGAISVAETYTYSVWSPRLDFSKPLESLARKYLYAGLNESFERRIKAALEVAKEFEVDGAVIHVNRSCKPYSSWAYELKNALRDELEIPSAVFEADMTDPRVFSREQVRTRLDALIEAMSERARR